MPIRIRQRVFVRGRFGEEYSSMDLYLPHVL